MYDEKTEKLIKKIFDYYNGKINPDNEAKLVIDIEHNTGDNFDLVLPNIIVVYPYAVMETYKSYLYRDIIYVKGILQLLCALNMQYRYDKCEEFAENYIKENILEVYDLIGIKLITKESAEYRFNMCARPMYILHHLDYVEHIYTVLIDLALADSESFEDRDFMYDQLLYAITTKTRVKLIINGNSIYIKNNFYNIAIPEFNILIDDCLKDISNKISHRSYTVKSDDSSNLIIEIKIS